MVHFPSNYCLKKEAHIQPSALIIYNFPSKKILLVVKHLFTTFSSLTRTLMEDESKRNVSSDIWRDFRDRLFRWGEIKSKTKHFWVHLRVYKRRPRTKFCLQLLLRLPWFYCLQSAVVQFVKWSQHNNNTIL